MGNSLLLRLVKVLLEGCADSLPHYRHSPPDCAQLASCHTTTGLAYSVTLLYLSPLVLSAFLMVTILLQSSFRRHRIGVASGISLVNMVIWGWAQPVAEGTFHTISVLVEIYLTRYLTGHSRFQLCRGPQEADEDTIISWVLLAGLFLRHF